MRKRVYYVGRLRYWGGGVLVALLWTLAVSLFPISAGLAPGRERLPVVLRGAHLGDWVGTKQIDHIYLYKYDPASNPSWIRINFQIDKRRKVNIVHDIGDPVLVGSLLEDPADICVLSYFKSRYCDAWASGAGVRECPLTYGAAFDSSLLAATDEIVFMARDLQGATRDQNCPRSWPAGAGVGSNRVEVMVTDDGNNDGVITADEKFWIYAFEWTSAPPNPPSDASPTYAHESCGTPCSGGNASNNVFNEHCGSATGPATTSNVEGFKVLFASNWETTDFEVINTGGTELGDIWESMNFRMGGQTHPTWSCHNLPRPLGPASASLQPGDVRFVRGVQGARSGFATRKYDKVYDSIFETEIELRVHDITDLTRMQGHNSDVRNQTGVQSSVWINSVKMSDHVPYDSAIDGSSPSPAPGDPELDDWTEILNDGELGGTVTRVFVDPDRGPIDAATSDYLYMDMSAPYGNFGNTYTTISCMQDGTYREIDINDGGCGPSGDPEGSYLLFKRLLRVNIPRQPVANALSETFVKGEEWEYAVQHPIESGAFSLQSQSCGGAPQPICTPTLGANALGDGGVGLAANLSGGSGCQGDASGFGFTREVGSSGEEIIKYVGPSGTARDMMTAPGQAHTYRVFALASDGRVSAKSTPVVVTPGNTTAPPPPVIKSAVAIDGGATVDFEPCVSGDGFFTNFFVSTTSGGPYTQVNSQPVYVGGPKQFTVSGLENYATYYIVATLVDHAGNSSTYSTELAVTPSP